MISRVLADAGRWPRLARPARTHNKVFGLARKTLATRQLRGPASQSRPLKAALHSFNNLSSETDTRSQTRGVFVEFPQSIQGHTTH